MRPTSTVKRDLQPVATLGKAVGTCSSQARVYGACVVASYDNVHRDMCQREFEAFKTCVVKKMGRKW